MSYETTATQRPAPCIIDTGIIVQKDDMKRLLSDLGRVQYQHYLEGQLKSEGEGWVLEVFSHPTQSTVVANHTLYINLQSFDYLELTSTPEKVACFDLYQDNRQLRLVPATRSNQEPDNNRRLDSDTLEAMVTQVLSAKWDVQFDEDEDCPF